MTTRTDVGDTPWRGRAPLVVATVIPLAILAVLPWRGAELLVIPGFTSLWLAALILSDLLVAYLLIGEYRAGGSPRLLVVSWAYLWSAAVAVMLLFVVPGVLTSDNELYDDTNVVQWLWVWRHVFPALLLGLALVPSRRTSGPGSATRDPRLVVAGSTVVIAAISAAFALVCWSAPDALPTIVAADGHLVGWLTALVLLVCAGSVAVAAVGVWRRSVGGQTQRLESWAVVASATFLGDALLTFMYEDRFTATYYLARLLGLAASVFVLMAILRDIGRIHVQANETAQRLEVRNAELVEVQKLRDHLTAVVSHDLRTPLAGLQGYLEMLADDDLESPLAHRMIERSWMLTRRLTLLTEDLLAAATLANGDLVLRPEPVDVGGQLSECAWCFPDLDLELDCPTGLTAYADPLRLQQVLTNLVRNAQKHGAEPVLIAAAADPDAPGGVVIRVSDAGPGVPETFAPRLFERYTQGIATATGGSGLGLSVVRDLVTGHHGTIRYEPEGNAFVVTLPPGPADAPVTGPSAPAASRTPRAAARG